MTSAHAQTLQSDIETARAEAGLIGVVAAVSVDGEIVERAADGMRRKGRSEPITANDLVHVGSIGKSMSATAIARLVERGVLDWDDTVGERMPELAAEIDPGWHGVTLDQMLGHRAALPALGIRQLFQGGTGEEPLQELRAKILKGMLAKPPKSEPGSVFAYCNTGYVLASAMVEAATGRVWEDILVEEVAEPLGLGTLGIGAPTGGAAPWGHRKLFGFKLAMDPADGADNPPMMSAAGTMHISLDDLLAYGNAHLQMDPDYLSPDTWERLHAPVMGGYAYGWVAPEHRDWAGGPVLWHNGSNTYWYALLALAPEKNMVVAVASNDGDVERADAAFTELVKSVGARYPASEP